MGLRNRGTFEHMSEGTDENVPTTPTDQTSPDSQAGGQTQGSPQGETLGAPTPESGAVRDPEHWVTGDEPMTGPQRSYLDNLARQAGEELPADLNKAQASEHIDRLQQKVDGAGQGQGQGDQAQR
ncbi:MAG: transposase [Marmoricola sp.]|nr:transposase [Marmoricola sp.]